MAREKKPVFLHVVVLYPNIHFVTLQQKNKKLFDMAMSTLYNR